MATAASIASACVIYKIVSPRLPRRTWPGKGSRRPERGGEKGLEPQGRDGQSADDCKAPEASVRGTWARGQRASGKQSGG